MNHYLVADIGGTNARVGLVTGDGNEVYGIEQFSNKDFPSLADVIMHFLSKAQCAILPKQACFAVASPVTGDEVAFTNNSWSFSIADLKYKLGLDLLHVMNDFEAVARSLPYLGEQQLRQIGCGAAKDRHTMAVIGPGTGLGMAALIPALPAAIPLATEGGHASFGAQDEREGAVAGYIKNKIGFVSNEDLLSGQGLQNILGGLAHYYGHCPPELDAAALVDRALGGSDPLCLETLEYFCGILGSVAGDYALQVGAQGGVYIAGGIVPRFIEFLEKSSFRRRFEEKGRFASYVSAIPTYVIIGSQPGLIGAASIFDDEIGRRMHL